MSIFNPLSFISFPSFLASRVGIKLVSFGSSMLHAAYANHVRMCMLWIHCSVAFLWCTCAPLLPLTADSALLITVMLPCACRAACRFPCGHGWKAVRLAGGWHPPGERRGCLHLSGAQQRETGIPRLGIQQCMSQQAEQSTLRVGAHHVFQIKSYHMFHNVCQPHDG